jgi:hypothetical protein
MPSLEKAARSLKVAPIPAPVHSEGEIEPAIIALGREPGSGLVGWTEGGNLQIDYRWATLPQDVDRYAAELVALNPDVLFGTNTPTTQALRRRTRTIPIVFAGPADPVGTDLAVSFGRQLGAPWG